MSTYLVKKLEQAKLLTDPFKLKLLEKFAEGPITTKQVADALGEKAPRLYRHVEALADAGFLELVSEKKKRGTTERYFKTTASRFEIDPDMFSPGDEDETMGMLRGLFRETLEEIADALRAHGMASNDNQDAGIVSRLVIRADADDIAEIRRRLHDVLDSIASLEDADTGEDEEHWAGMIAFYPVKKK